MATISIHPTGTEPLVFSGEILVRSLSETDSHGRHYVLTVYNRTDSPLMVPCIEYVPGSAPEPPFTVAEQVDGPSELEKFFGVFEPLERMECPHVRALSAEERHAFTNRLFQIYDRAVVELLGKLSFTLTQKSASE